MAPKRPREDAALVCFADAVARLSPVPEAARVRKTALAEAHKWGDAMASAQLAALRAAGVSAAARFARLETSARGWHARGVLLYLVPGSDSALGEQRLPLPLALHSLSAQQLRLLAFQEADEWLRQHRRARAYIDAERERDEEAQAQAKAQAQAQAQAQARARARAHTTPPNAVRRHPAPNAKRPWPLLPPRSAPRPTHAPHLALPTGLSALLASKPPGVPRAPSRLSSPSACMRTQIDEMLRESKILRVWEDRVLATLPMRTCMLQLRIEENDLEALFGGGTRVDSHNKLLDAGLKRVNRGTFNTVWVAAARARAAGGAVAAFPEEVQADFVAGRVVLRAPHDQTRWTTFDEMVSEAHNIVFTACRGFGPRVAALSYTRKLAACKSHKQEGAVAPVYKLLVFLERATSNADERYVATALPTSSALTKPYYFSSLLVTIYELSNEGFVHLDATLRNFVDFYPTVLGRATSQSMVNVIDVDPSCFRRLRPEATADWRFLFLFNLLFVIVSLKVRLADRWEPAQHWLPLRACVEDLIAQLPPRGEGGGGIAGALLWEGPFRANEPFPDIARGPLAGETDAAATGAASALLRFYLIQQPVNEALHTYVNFVAANAVQAQKARAWYELVYRKQLLPPLKFFLGHMEPKLGVPPRRWVDVARDFLATPHSDLIHRYVSRDPPSPSASQACLLGIGSGEARLQLYN